MAAEKAPLNVVPVDDEFDLVETEEGWSLRKKMIVGGAVVGGVLVTGYVIHKLTTSPGKPSSMRGMWGTQEVKDRVEIHRVVENLREANKNLAEASQRYNEARRVGNEDEMKKWEERVNTSRYYVAENLRKLDLYSDGQHEWSVESFETAQKRNPHLGDDSSEAVQALNSRVTQDEGIRSKLLALQADARNRELERNAAVDQNAIMDRDEYIAALEKEIGELRASSGSGS